MARSVRLRIGLLGFFLIGLMAYAQELQQPLIEQINVRGIRRIPEDTIRFYVQTKPGDLYSKTRLDSDIQALYKTTFFENIRLEERDGDAGKIITFVVKEKPIIRSIEYVGNTSFAESDILNAYKESKIGLTSDVQYDLQNIKAAERILKDLMIQHGKPLGVVRTEIENMPPLSIRIRFLLDEDPKIGVDPHRN